MNRLSAPVFAIVLAPLLAHADPLPPEPDKGFVTEVHKAQVGNIVFARTLQAVTTPEKPGEFSNAFKSSDSIFLRAYLPMSLNNGFRAQGVRCADPKRVWKIVVDGSPVTAGKSPFWVEPIDQNGFKQSTSIRYDKALNAPHDSDSALWNQFNALVAPSLNAGEHTIELAVSGECADLDHRRESVQLAKDLAVGKFKLTVAEGAAKVSVLAAPARKDPKLEQEAAKILEQEWRGDKVMQVVFTERDWTPRYERVLSRQVLTHRTIAAEVAVKQSSGCRVFEVTFQQEAKGPGFGPTTRRGTGGNRVVSCAALK